MKAKKHFSPISSSLGVLLMHFELSRFAFCALIAVCRHISSSHHTGAKKLSHYYCDVSFPSMHFIVYRPTDSTLESVHEFVTVSQPPPPLPRSPYLYFSTRFQLIESPSPQIDQLSVCKSRARQANERAEREDTKEA